MHTIEESGQTKTLIKGNGKLLVSGEYFVLDGAKAFALPCKFGQQFEIMEYPSASQTPQIKWNAFNAANELWLGCVINLQDLRIESAEAKEADMLLKIIATCKALNPAFLASQKSYEVSAKLEFPNNWGLGSSSTLIYFMASWANINPYLLLEKTFGGSGYDIACASNDSAIYYTRNETNPLVEQIDFYPSFKDQLYFVHLNQKMNSRNAISYYKQLSLDKKPIIEEINKLSTCFVEAKSLTDFEKCMLAHEELLSKTLKIERVKQTLFKDYWGEVKSLGAWGGDFVMISNDRDEATFKSYLKEKGFCTVLSYDEMILHN